LLLLNRLKTILKKTLLSQAKITTTVSAAGCVICFPKKFIFFIANEYFPDHQIDKDRFVNIDLYVLISMASFHRKNVKNK
jgi:hypothetical protein